MTIKRVNIIGNPDNLIVTAITNALYLKFANVRFDVNVVANPWINVTVKLDVELTGEDSTVSIKLYCDQQPAGAYRFKVQHEKANYPMILDTIGLVKKLERVLCGSQTFGGYRRGDIATAAMAGV